MSAARTDDPGLSPQLQRTLEASGVGTYSFDTATGGFVVDTTCRRLFDIDTDTPLSPEMMASRIHAEDLQRYWEAARTSMRTGNFACDYRVVHRNGEVRFVSGRGHLERAAPGTPPRVRGVCIDVTSKMELADQLHATQARMQELADGLELVEDGGVGEAGGVLRRDPIRGVAPAEPNDQCFDGLGRGGFLTHSSLEAGGVMQSLIRVRARRQRAARGSPGSGSVGRPWGSRNPALSPGPFPGSRMRPANWEERPWTIRETWSYW